jgi:hypothetical protein
MIKANDKKLSKNGKKANSSLPTQKDFTRDKTKMTKEEKELVEASKAAIKAIKKEKESGFVW